MLGVSLPKLGVSPTTFRILLPTLGVLSPICNKLAEEHSSLANRHTQRKKAQQPPQQQASHGITHRPNHWLFVGSVSVVSVSGSVLALLVVASVFIGIASGWANFKHLLYLCFLLIILQKPLAIL